MKKIKLQKKQIIIISIVAVLFILLLLAMIKIIFPSNNGSVYGNRLSDNIEIKDTDIEKVQVELKKNDIVSTISYHLNVKTLKLTIKLTEKATKEKAIALGDIIKTNLTEEIRNCYDIEIYLLKENDEEFPLIGHLHVAKDTFSFNNHEVGETDE